MKTRDVIACLLDEGEKTYVNEEHTARISANQFRVGEMVTLAEDSTMNHTIVKKAGEGDLVFGYLLGKVQCFYLTNVISWIIINLFS